MAGDLHLPSLGGGPGPASDGGTLTAGAARALLPPRVHARAPREVARSLGPVRGRVRRPLEAREARRVTRAGFLFPGQLSELVGMGRDFFEADVEVRRLILRINRRRQPQR